MIKLSLCMVLRDEGKTIKRCLDSMVGLVDEWIIGIDTQTKDDTKQIVNSFFDEHKDITEWTVYDYEWKDSFSKARNEGMDKATGTHILIMDGHEYFPDRFYNITEKREIDNKFCFNHMKKSLETTDLDEGQFHLYQQPFIGNTPNNYFLQPRIYRNAPDIRFGRDAHNTIQNTNPDKVIHFPEIIIIHNAPVDNRVWRKEQRIRMNTKALQDDIDNNPQDTRAMFYLGNTRMEAEDWSQAIHWFKRYLDICKVDHDEKYQVLLHKSISHKMLNEFSEARDSSILAVGINPNRRDAYMNLGNLYFDNEQYDRAVFYYNSALRINPESSRMFQNGAVSTWDPHQRLAYAYEKLKNYPSAVAHLKTAMSYLDNPAWQEKIDEWKQRKPNLLILDHIGSFTKDLISRIQKSEQFNLMVLKEYDSKLVQWADFIFCEWGDMNAYRCGKNTAIANKTVVRIHGYEAYANRELLAQIDWLSFKRVVFVAEHIKDMLKDIITNGIVIPNGVDTEKFSIKNYKRNRKNIGYAGYINEKKNPFLLIELIKENPHKVFNLRVDFQSPYWEETFKYELKDCKNVVYHERYENLEDFWNEMDSVISTSIVESFSYNIGEAMSCGCKPYIYNWKGARSIWPEEYIFNERPKFEESEEREKYRKVVTDRYDASEHVPELLRTIING